jgi:hypothetical protein
MFRTSRAFLLAAPVAFGVTLAAFLILHPKAPEAFAAYPFMADALGAGVVKSPQLRFLLTTVVFFVVPYLAIGVLLLLAELGIGAAVPLLGGGRKPRGGAGEVAPESRWAFLAVTLGVAAWAGASLHRVAQGGDLPGGVNVTPVFIVAASFGAIAAGLLASLLAAVPRGLLGGAPAPRVRRSR